jgi:hypothetical protein
MIVSCKIASALISESLDRPLTPYQKLEVKIHLFLCRYFGGKDCNNYAEQIDFIHKAAHGFHAKPRVGAGAKLKPAEKERLKKRLRSAWKEKGRS